LNPSRQAFLEGQSSNEANSMSQGEAGGIFAAAVIGSLIITAVVIKYMCGWDTR